MIKIAFSSDYQGPFLPGFESSMVSNDAAQSPKTTSHMDHVTYVCDEGQSGAILKWYSDVFGMRRFLVNRAEGVDEGN